MGTDENLFPNNVESDSTGNDKASNSSNCSNTMPRAQSNLDILSQTAAVIEEVNSGCISAQTSPPYPPARVTPAEHHHAYYQLPHTIPYSVDSTCSRSLLSLPDMTNNSYKQHHHNSQSHPMVFLEQKRGFLPPALPFECSGGIMVGAPSTAAIDVPAYYSSGIQHTYSHGSSSSVTLSSSGSNLVSTTVDQSSLKPSTPPPLLHVPKHRTLVATVSTESNKSGGSDSCGHHAVGGGDVPTVVNSFLSAASNSFSSAGGASVSASSMTGGIGASASFPLPGTQVSVQAAFAPPHQPIYQRTDGESNLINIGNNNIEFSNETLRENFLLRQELAARDRTISNLQSQIETLEHEVGQLRQLPTGKISQIPLEDMITIMREYGSEVSETTMPPRKSFVQKASVVRQFRRWNPNFIDWFEHVNGKWIPKLGKAGEIKRREESRQIAGQQRKKQRTDATAIVARSTPLNQATTNKNTTEASDGSTGTEDVKNETEI